MAIVGLGGTGRGEMAPFSDLDLMFLTAAKPSPSQEKPVEAFLHLLWDLKIKVGHSVRSIAELLTLAKTDMTVRTAFLEARLIWGEQAIFDQAMQRFRAKIVSGTAAEFVAAKLAERDERHRRMGDTRYVVEPNVKDGKGGLRDLHTLYWIGKYVHGVEEPADLVRVGLFTAAEFKKFERAERFFWAVRCHLHSAPSRAEDRLGFDHQQQIAEVMRYADRPGKSAVERFMQFYFINAKAVGDLTGIFLAQLDEQLGKKGFRFALPTIRRRPKRLSGFVLDRGRLSIPGDDFFAEDPVPAARAVRARRARELEIHPTAMRAAARDAKLIDDNVRKDPRANALFLDVLTCVNSPELVLRWMNEAGVFGRFVPDFGRVVAQMQFDMYHHYTVDEHSIRAIGLLAAIERGELKKDHPLSTALFKQIGSRRTLYVAVLLHDIAKGRGGDHSEIGAEIALKLGPRFGLDPAETETVSWLVRYHLLMSATAFKRDLADPKTVEDFVRAGAKPGAPAAAADPDRGRHPRGRPGRLERMEARAPANLVRSGGGTAAPRAQAARPARAGRGTAGGACQGARLEGERRAGACEAPSRQLLARRAARMAAGQRAAGRRCGGAYRRCRAERRRRGRSGQRLDAGQRVHARPRGPVLPDLRRARRRRRQHHRCANPHDARRHGARQSAREGRAGPRLCRPPPAQPADQIGRDCADAPMPPRRFRGRRARAGPRRSGLLRSSRSPSARRAGRRWSRSMRATVRHCSPAWRGRSTIAALSCIPRISPPMASARSTSSI